MLIKTHTHKNSIILYDQGQAGQTINAVPAILSAVASHHDMEDLPVFIVRPLFVSVCKVHLLTYHASMRIVLEMSLAAHSPLSSSRSKYLHTSVTPQKQVFFLKQMHTNKRQMHAPCICCVHGELVILSTAMSLSAG